MKIDRVAHYLSKHTVAILANVLDCNQCYCIYKILKPLSNGLEYYGQYSQILEIIGLLNDFCKNSNTLLTIK
jgi:hypothetical protein